MSVLARLQESPILTDTVDGTLTDTELSEEEEKRKARQGGLVESLSGV